ncbi:MAG: peptidase domain-containing ABC transporter [Alphaproteobacteria bacterium]|nr:peptidase domain-containing ABC transporter [Alphaproteobacteria bacterium]
MTNIAKEAVQFVLDTNIMFNVLPSKDKLKIKPLVEVRNFEKDDVIAKQGEPVDGMYVIYSGKVRVKKFSEGKITCIDVLEEENSIGEMSMLRKVECQNDFIAIVPVSMFFIPSDKIRAMLPNNQAMEEHFKSHVGLIEVSYRIKAMLGKAKYTPEQFMVIIGNLGVKNIPEGKAIYVQGKSDPRLYYIEKGIVELTCKAVSGETISLDKVRHGAIIGESGALSEISKEGLQQHTAKALSDSTVLVIKQEAVKQILEINPEIHERLRERVVELQQYEEEELNIRKRSEGLDLRIKLAEGLTEEDFKQLEKKEEVSKYPIIRQSREEETAVACLTMVCNAYDKNFSLGQIKELTALEGKMITPDNLIKAAEVIGFRAKAYSLDYEAMKDLQLPAIISWEGYHYVVVYKVTDKGVQIADPDKGVKFIKKKDFLPSWSAAKIAGVAETNPEHGMFIAFEPTQAFEQKEPPKNPYMHFINYILPHKKFFAEAILAALIINILGLASPLFIQTIVDTVVVHHDVSLLNMMLSGMVLVSVFSTLTSISQSLLLAHTTARIDMRLMSEFYRHILSLPMDFFMTRNKGEILARFGENQKIRAIIAGSSITVLLNLLMITIYFMMMFAYNTKLTLVVIFFIPIYIGIVTFFTPKIKKIAQEIFLTGTQSQSFLIESLNGIETIKATANEYFARARWEETFSKNVNRSFKQQKLILTSQSLFGFASLGSTIVVLWIGANEVMAGSLTIGELMGFNMLMGLVTGPVLQMVDLWNQLQEVRIAVDRVGDVLIVEPEQQAVSDPENIPVRIRSMKGRIEFTDVNFSYTTDDKTKYVMREFNLTIEPGEHIAFVGPSGCGKSTIAKTILGFNRPNSGIVHIDGRNLNEMDIYSLRRNIGVVLQDSFIISGSVAENIALGDPSPDMQLVKEASHLAGADEFIINYPLGYQTLIGEKGMGISGGQRQRICIARALYHKPKIMIFDEATSALDNESELRITEQLKLVMRNRTSITIAHRLSTIMDLDRICYIDDGQVQEEGTHKQLIDPEYIKNMGFKGHYYNLAKTQFDLPELDLS